MDYDSFSDSLMVEALVSTNSVIAEDVLGEIIDTQGYNSIVAGLLVSDVTSGTISAVTFEEGDDPALADAADIDSSLLLITPADLPVIAAGLLQVGCVSKKRYVRLKVTTLGGAVDITMYALADLGHCYSKPSKSVI